ncbi:MarR family winged helix-turn-helix transcriptional regulator [Arthrobacter sp. A5]|uniref:MarR family winged helix-turn-helix transcriptional regulator n=1 Tax=Arthrobacter sp. A5 TaxID=576926 RepID=UPI003DA7ED50
MTAEENSKAPNSYWYAGASAGSAVEVLQALRRFHAADAGMRRRLKADMDMNETDLSALRHLIAAEPSGHAIGPTDLTRKLGISSAATAKLLGRMARTGHVRREPNPLDRRAQLLYATTKAHHEVHKSLGSMHERMFVVAAGLPADQQQAVIRFLDLLSAAVDAPGGSA